MSRLHDALRISPPRWPPLVDVAIMACFVALSTSEIFFNSSVGSSLGHALFVTTPLVALAWRRQYPIVVAVVVLVSNVSMDPNHEFTSVLTLVLCAYTVGVETSSPRTYVGLAAMLAPFVGVLALGGALVPSDIAAAMVFLVGPWVVGVTTRRRTERAVAAVTVAERRLREQEIRAREAVAAERTRIARELHDVVSHSISVVTIQTQAVRRRLGKDHAAEAKDLAVVEATAREAQAEMRRLFGMLRTEGESAAMAPQPGLAELRRLVESVAGSGREVALRVEGEPTPLSPGLDLAAYRIAQEGLTNALRHSGARRITVTVRHRPHDLEVEVCDDGHGLRPSEDAGQGLTGIRERVALYDGTVHLEEQPTGGVRLAARFPLVGHA